MAGEYTVKEHASDCALHNAPYRIPEPCSCGASPRFKVWGYNVRTDEFGFAPHSRETLIAEVAAAVLLGFYEARPPFPKALLIRRAITSGLTLMEVNGVLQHWRRATVDDELEREYLARRGIADRFVDQDLSPLPPAVRATIIEEPTVEEIVAALTPWCDYHEVGHYRVVNAP